MKRLVLAALALACLSLSANARPVLHPACNISMPCEPMLISSTSKEVAKINMTRRDIRGRVSFNRPPQRYERIGISVYRGRNSGHGVLGYTEAIVRPSSESPIGSYGLVERARAYLGQTAGQLGLRRTLWCSAFLRFVTGARGVDDRAISWLAKPRVGPAVGSIAVMRHHVGIVAGFNRRGDPIIVSGNHGRRVGIGAYSARRVLAYVGI